MSFRQYTKCYVHTPGDRPFQKKDIAGVAALYGVLPGVLFGVLAGLVAGFAVGGPIGAAVGVIVALFSTVAVGTALALTKVSNEWRNHRLVCLGGAKCAVGTVRKQPERGDLGEFDNDQFFDLTLMPHRTGHGTDDPKGPPLGNPADTLPNGDDYALPSDNYKTGAAGIVFDDEANALNMHPKNDVYTDGGLQGSTLLRPTIDDLPYDTTRSYLHCEAEGDFWVRMSALALAIGLLAASLAVATAAAAGAGAYEGAAAGCAIGGFFGPIGCLIGAIIGAIAGALAGGAAAAALSTLIIKGVLQGIFDGSGHGNVEDANVGDARLGAISAGDRVVVYGAHVFDGFHEGWHEFHPLMKIVKVSALHGVDREGKPAFDESPFYLEWDPHFPDNGALPADLPDIMPAMPPDKDITKLTVNDMRAGLSSEKFARRATWIRDTWCGLLGDSARPGLQSEQLQPAHRWTIHPDVDGCARAVPDPGVLR